MRMIKPLYFEAVGTFLLALIVSASGYIGYTISNGNVGLTLFINSVITGIGLYALIAIIRPISGAQFNPIVSLLLRIKGKQTTYQTILYILFQVIGAILGILFMHLLFDLPIVQSSTTVRSSINLWISEFFSSLVLLYVIQKTFDLDDTRTGVLVGLTVMIGYWVTSSTFFANPSLTLARSFTDTFVGIRLSDIGMFILFQLCAVFVVSIIHRIEMNYAIKNK